MKKLIVSIDQLTDTDFPGWVQCSLVDAFGKKHLFNEKVPVVISGGELIESNLPQEGCIQCTVGAISSDGPEAMLVVNTIDVDGVESTEGISEFTVRYNQII